MKAERVEINRRFGRKPVIKGTEVTVESILRKLADGTTEDQILGDFPQLTRQDIRAALEYAADALSNGEGTARRTEPGGPSASRRPELERQRAARFPSKGKQQRVAAALHVLETLRFGMPVDIEVAKWAAQDPELEDF